MEQMFYNPYSIRKHCAALSHMITFQTFGNLLAHMTRCQVLCDHLITICKANREGCKWRSQKFEVSFPSVLKYFPSPLCREGKSTLVEEWTSNMAKMLLKKFIFPSGYFHLGIIFSNPLQLFRPWVISVLAVLLRSKFHPVRFYWILRLLWTLLISSRHFISRLGNFS